MTAYLEVHKVKFIPNSLHGEPMGVARVAPLPVILTDEYGSGKGFVGSASQTFFFNSKYDDLVQWYGRSEVTIPTDSDAEDVRSLLLMSYLTFGEIDANQAHRNASQFANIAPSTIALIAYKSFLEKDLPHLVSDEVVSKNIKPGQKERVVSAYERIMRDRQYTPFDSELLRTFCNVTV